MTFWRLTFWRLQNISVMYNILCETCWIFMKIWDIMLNVFNWQLISLKVVIWRLTERTIIKPDLWVLYLSRDDKTCIVDCFLLLTSPFSPVFIWNVVNWRLISNSFHSLHLRSKNSMKQKHISWILKMQKTLKLICIHTFNS